MRSNWLTNGCYVGPSTSCPAPNIPRQETGFMMFSGAESPATFRHNIQFDQIIGGLAAGPHTGPNHYVGCVIPKLARKCKAECRPTVMRKVQCRVEKCEPKDSARSDAECNKSMRNVKIDAKCSRNAMQKLPAM